MQSIQTVLILAPHTDDAELGCGGTIARFLEEGKKIYVAAFSTARASLPDFHGIISALILRLLYL